MISSSYNRLIIKTLKKGLAYTVVHIYIHIYISHHQSLKPMAGQIIFQEPHYIQPVYRSIEIEKQQYIKIMGPHPDPEKHYFNRL